MLEYFKVVEPYLDPLLKRFEDMMHKIVNFSDPITVAIVLFIVLSPIALAYMVVARIAMVKMGQMKITGKNILYVIAHPDDEAM